MIRFLDGPAEGESLVLRRAPLFLRVVQSLGGKWDALDQLSDEPKPTETIHVYAKSADQGGTFWKCTSRFESGWLPNAEYRLCAEQPSDEEARDTERWRQWAEAQREKERAKHPTV